MQDRLGDYMEPWFKAEAVAVEEQRPCQEGRRAEEREAREARFGGMQDEVTPRSGAARRKTDTAEVGGVGRRKEGGRPMDGGRWVEAAGGRMTTMAMRGRWRC